jgi:hypothetical protein
MNTSASLLAEFDHLLQQEVEAYKRLLALHQEAQHCLAAPALDPLLANLQAREHLAHHILQVEHQRAAVATQLVPLRQLPATDVTLHHVSMWVDEPYASRFRPYCTQLRAPVDALQQHNHTQAHPVREIRTLWMPCWPLRHVCCRHIRRISNQGN